MAGIAASPRGYAVLQGTIVSFSADGRAWTQSSLPFTSTSSNGVALGAHANAIVGGRDGFVVVGGYDIKPCTNEQGAGGPPPCMVAPISWVSSDGITWTSSLPTPIPSTGSKLPPYSEIVQIWAAPNGWDAAVEARDSVRNHGNTLLHSADGLVWSRLKAPPLPDGSTSGDDVYSHGGIASAAGRRVVWQIIDPSEITRTALATSADGVSWTSIPGFDGANAVVRVAMAPAGDGTAPWVLFGDRYGPESHTIVWWQSDDLQTWRSGTMTATGEPIQAIGAVGTWGDGYIALGTKPPDNYQDIPATWLSADGRAWNPVEVADPSSLDGPVAMTDGPVGLIGVGTSETGSIVWLGVGPTP